MLFLHITAGIISLISGGLAASLRKKRGLHSAVGSVFVYAMYVTGITGVGLSFYILSYFLLGISIFTLYMVLTGSTAFRGHSPRRRKRISIAGFTGSALLIAISTHLFITSGINGIIPLVFGSILFVMSIQDRRSAGRKKRSNPLILHMNRMGGAYIATITAFLTTGGPRLFDRMNWDVSEWTLFFWLFPTVIGSILLTIANIRVRKV